MDTVDPCLSRYIGLVLIPRPDFAHLGSVLGVESSFSRPGIGASKSTAHELGQALELRVGLGEAVGFGVGQKLLARRLPSVNKETCCSFAGDLAVVDDHGQKSIFGLFLFAEDAKNRRLNDNLQTERQGNKESKGFVLKGDLPKLT